MGSFSSPSSPGDASARKKEKKKRKAVAVVDPGVAGPARALAASVAARQRARADAGNNSSSGGSSGGSGGGSGGDKLGGDNRDLARRQRLAAADQSSQRLSLLEPRNNPLARSGFEQAKPHFLSPAADRTAGDAPVQATRARQAGQRAEMKAQARPGMSTDAQVRDIKRMHRAEQDKLKTDKAARARLKETSSPWWQSSAKVSGEAHASNRRTVGGLLNHSTNGDLPNLFASAIKDSGKLAVAEFGNFMAQLDKRAPKRTQGFESQVLSKLDNRQKARHFPEAFNHPPSQKPTPPGTPVKPAGGLDWGAISPEVRGWLDESLKKSNPPAGSFVSPISNKYSEMMHMKESQKKNYQEFNPHGPAWGRYQITPIGLKQIGMMDVNNNWTGKYGIHNSKNFLSNTEAQEKALVEYTNSNIQQLKDKGTFKYIGQKIDGKFSKITVTKAGLLAAAHRQGAGMTNQYLKHIKEYGWKSVPNTFGGEKKTNAFLSIETRLREFQDIPYLKQ